MPAIIAKSAAGGKSGGLPLIFEGKEKSGGPVWEGCVRKG